MARIIRSGVLGRLGGRGALLLVVVVSLSLVLVISLSFGASTAVAQLTLSPTSCPLPNGSQFQGGDGNQLDEFGPAACPSELIDWQGFQFDGRVRHIPDPNANDTRFGGPLAGSGCCKELNPGAWVIDARPGQSTPESGNIYDTYFGADRQDGGNAFLYMAFTRAASTGTIYVAYELNQEARPWRYSIGSGYPIPCRRTDDLQIVFGNHGSQAAVSVDRWVTTPGFASTAPEYPGGPVGCASEGSLLPATLGAVDAQAAFNYTAGIANFLPVHQFYGPPGPIPSFSSARRRSTCRRCSRT